MFRLLGMFQCSTSMNAQEGESICCFFSISFSILFFIQSISFHYLITRLTEISIAPLMVLFCNCPLFRNCSLADL